MFYYLQLRDFVSLVYETKDYFKYVVILFLFTLIRLWRKPYSVDYAWAGCMAFRFVFVLTAVTFRMRKGERQTLIQTGSAACGGASISSFIGVPSLLSHVDETMLPDFTKRLPRKETKHFDSVVSVVRLTNF